MRLVKKMLLLLALLCGMGFSNDTLVDPYELSLPLDLTLLTVGGGMVIAGLALDEYKQANLSDVYALDPDDVSSFDNGALDNWNPEAANVSDVLMLTALAAPLTISVFKPARHAWKKNLLLTFESFALSRGMNLMTKNLVGRYRPYAYNEDLSDNDRSSDDARRSFYSGHATYAFMGAALFSQFLCDYYPESRIKPLIWASSLAVAGTAASLRVTSGKHFATDVLTGAGVGTITALFTLYSHKVVAQKKNISPVLQASWQGEVEMGVKVKF